MEAPHWLCTVQPLLRTSPDKDAELSCIAVIEYAHVRRKITGCRRAAPLYCRAADKVVSR